MSPAHQIECFRVRRPPFQKGLQRVDGIVKLIRRHVSCSHFAPNLLLRMRWIARNHLLKLQGHHSAREFQERLNRAIALAPGGRGGEMDVE